MEMTHKKSVNMTINRYIFKELLGPFGWGLFVFTFVFLLNKIIRLAELIIGKGVSLAEVFSLIGYILPSFLVLVIPSTVLLATLLGFGRLSADGEITALNASGVSFYQLLVPVMAFSLLCYAVTSWLMINALPQANLAFKRQIYEIIRTRSLVNIKQREFIDDFKGLVIYVDRVSPSGNKLKGVLISDKRHLPEPYIIMAREGNIIADPENLRVAIRLQGGSIQSLTADENFRQIDFERYQLNLDLSRFLERRDKKREREMNIAELRAEIARLRREGENYNPPLVELHKKFAIPFAALILGLVGAPLGINTRASSRSAGFAVSILIIFAYYILLRTGESLGELGKLPPLVCMWAPNILLCLIGGYLVYKTGHNSSIKWVNWLVEAVGRTAREIKSHLSR
jgi:lipopolysaccharide export system permease protein